MKNLKFHYPYNYKHKPCLIILEGVDRTGKTSVQRSLDILSDYRNFVMIRGPVGFLTYNRIYSKGVSEKDYYDLEKDIKEMRHLMVLLYAPPETLQRRAKETNEKQPLHKGGTWEEHLKIHNFYYQKSRLNKIKFDTSKNSSCNVAEQILEKLENDSE